MIKSFNLNKVNWEEFLKKLKTKNKKLKNSLNNTNFI
jgi:hypothetical protein